MAEGQFVIAHHTALIYLLVVDGIPSGNPVRLESRPKLQ